MESLDGVITFFSSQHVMKAEKILKQNGFNIMLIPGPREISPNCGVALCFEYKKKAEITKILNDSKVVFESIQYYPNAKKLSKWLDS